MFPLRLSDPLKKFPRASLAMAGFFGAADILSRVWPGPREDFLRRWALVPAEWSWTDPTRQGWGSWIFHAHLWDLLVTLIFVWIFSGALFERRRWPWVWGVSLVGAWLARGIFCAIFPESSVPFLSPEAFVGTLLGMAMCNQIWGQVHTLVIGPGWIRLYEVPSYVHLFFWCFYLFVGKLAQPEWLQGGPMPYILPMLSFLFGFLAELILSKALRLPDSKAY